MRKTLSNFVSSVAFLVLVPFGMSQAAPITGLYNTGVDDTSALLVDNAVDTHYTIGSTSWTAIAGNNPPPAFPGAWILNSASTASRWIAPATQPTSDTSDTLYVVSLSFDLTGFDSATASFSGRWAADNQGYVTLNGGSAFGQTPLTTGHATWTSFSASSGFLSGVNTLAFYVTNLGFSGTNPTGIRVEFESSNVNVTPIPEPEIYAMLGAGLGLMGWVARRRKKQATA